GFLKEKLKAIEQCRQTKPAPLPVCLVPVLVRGINNDEVGKIIHFALDNLDVVRGVNFQPVSFSGRINYEERIAGRYTQADAIKDSVEQTGFLSPDDWYPVPVAAAVSEVVSLLHGEPKLAFTCHPACGIGAYVFEGEDGKRCGVSKFIDIPGLYEEALNIAQEMRGVNHLQKMRVAIRTMKLLKYIEKDRMPKGMNLRSIIKDVLIMGNKEGMRKLHWKVLFLGAMHFMDRYNYDIERVKRCIVHYSSPDGRLIPFCAYNTGPTFRHEVEAKFAMSFDEYREQVKLDKAGGDDCCSS
ncbi:MAG TPA: radical SAM protein, partial [Thermoplasmata archaeon]|nr:radical SAM protein [Thermoplasmata archaeon]